jgi:FkbM family methyltransferase
MTFFDVGASAGLLAISAAKKLGGKGVFAFDACSSTCELLKRNLRLNDLSGVHVAQIAFSDSAGEGTLQLNARGRDGLNTLGQATHPDSRVVAQEKVRIATVDAFLKEHKIARVDVMKIDVQGAELRVLRGAQKLLERDDAPVLVYEGYGHTTRGFGYHPVEILWFLESCGYSFLSLNDLTGEISELKPDYQYDSTVIAAKPAHPAFEELRGRLK